VRIDDYFRKDVRQALHATMKRRIITYTPITVAIILGLVFWKYVPSWVWTVVVFGDLAVFLILGNHLANKDALARER
jgi:hypothetical protein